LDGCEEIVVSFVVTVCDGTRVFEFVEEAFDQIAVAIEKWAERRDIFAVRHGENGGAKLVHGSCGEVLLRAA
jgi:hypothetical protein